MVGSVIRWRRKERTREPHGTVAATPAWRSHRRVVVTGLGIVAPTGIGVPAFRDATRTGRTALRPIRQFDTGADDAYAGQLEGFAATAFMPARVAGELDPGSRYAVAACRLAADDAGLDLTRVDRERVGVHVGTCFGAGHGNGALGHLNTRSPQAFRATARFPAAPQRRLPALLGLHGPSRTVACDRASGLVSVAFAARLVAAGASEAILAGGCEAPITPSAYAACASEGLLATAGPRYRPFGVGRGGLIPGEGAAFLLLESLEHAVSRGARVYGEIAGTGITDDACRPRPLPDVEQGLSEAMEGALDVARLPAGAISFVLADAMAHHRGDLLEADALWAVFGARGVRVAAPKVATGHLYGGAGPLDVAWGALAIEHGEVPGTPGLEQVDPECPVAIDAAPVRSDVSAVMVNARGSGGVNASLVLRRVD